MKLTTVILLLALSSYLCAIDSAKEIKNSGLNKLETTEANQLVKEVTSVLRHVKEGELSKKYADYSS